MEYLSIVLLVALGVMFALNRKDVDEHFQRLEKKVDDPAGVDRLIERLDQLEQRVLQLDPEPARQELSKMRGSIAHLLETPPTPEPPAGAEQLPRAQEVRLLAERYLHAQGCELIQVLSTDSELDHDEVEVRIEAMREGLCLKGRLKISGTDVRDTGLDNTHKLFP
jgi:hypothetical protein